MTSDALENFRRRVSQLEMQSTALVKRTANGINKIGAVSRVFCKNFTQFLTKIEI